MVGLQRSVNNAFCSYQINPAIMSISIGIKKTNGESFHVTLPASESTLVDHLRERVAAVAGIPPNETKLIFRGKVLKDGTTLESYSVVDGVVIHLMKQQVPPPSAEVGSSASEPSSVGNAASHQHTPVSMQPHAQVFQMSFPPGMQSPPFPFTVCKRNHSRLPQA
jgi:hypothetical protein